MIILDFKGPFQFHDLVDTNDAYNPGIYIWGFKYPDLDKFIPYYVGKSLTNIVGRIAQHKKDILKDDSTYIRLSDSFMRSFYRDDKFDKLKNPHKYDVEPPIWFYTDFQNDEIDYINARWFIKLKKKPDPGKNKERQDYPISLLKPTNDFLKNNIEGLFICYAVVSEANIPNLRKLETMTFYSLKGKTKSKTDKCPEVNLEINIVDKTNTRIFKEVNKKVQPNNKFPGY